jgi:hypothetical protein
MSIIIDIIIHQHERIVNIILKVSSFNYQLFPVGTLYLQRY